MWVSLQENLKPSRHGDTWWTGPFSLSWEQSEKQILHRQMRMTQQMGSPSLRTHIRLAGLEDKTLPRADHTQTPGRSRACQASTVSTEQGDKPRSKCPVALSELFLASYFWIEGIMNLSSELS